MAFKKFIFFILILLIKLAHAQYFLKTPIDVKNTLPEKKEFSFFLIGHAYGFPDTLRPVESLVNFVEKISAQEYDFGIFLGDHVFKFDSQYIANFNLLICSKLNIPLFNAIGNHEGGWSGGNNSIIDYHWDKYNQVYGKTYFSFIYNKSGFVFIDSKIPYDSIIEFQTSFIDSTLKSFKQNDSLKNVFICSHHILWINSILNTNDIGKIPEFNYNPNNSEFDNLNILKLTKLLEGKKVYWLTGDGYLPILFYSDTINNITYVQTCLADKSPNSEYANLIKVNVLNNGEVYFDPISLTGNKLQSIENYNFDYWKQEINKINKKKYYKYLINDFINFKIPWYIYASIILTIAGGVLIILIYVKEK